MVVQLKQLLQKFVDNTPKISRYLREEQAMTLWAEAVGEKISEHASPSSVKDGILTVLTKSPAWAQELRFLKKEIIKKLNERAGETVFSDIRFKTTGFQKGGLNG